LINIKLLLANLWIPKKRVLAELKTVYKTTNRTLDTLLTQYKIKIPKTQKIDNLKPKELRIKMAKEHNKKVQKLIKTIGKKTAINQARKKLFNTGQILGQKAKKDLNIKNSTSDILNAAKILYKILGINFKAKKINKTTYLMIINRCSLSKHYKNSTCQILSAVDEGVLSGLNPQYKMQFQKRITQGAPKCKAKITIVKEGEQ
jgi:hypothetical protein